MRWRPSSCCFEPFFMDLTMTLDKHRYLHLLSTSSPALRKKKTLSFIILLQFYICSWKGVSVPQRSTENPVIPHVWLNQSSIMECSERGSWEEMDDGIKRKNTYVSTPHVLLLKIDKRKTSACECSRKCGVKAGDMAYIKTSSCCTCSPIRVGMNINESGNDAWEM